MYRYGYGQPIIVDVRANGGGSEPTAQTFAGCFFNKSAVYAKNTTVRDGNFIGPFDRAVEPNKIRQPFRGRSVVLMGQGTVSSSESFVMMMKQAPACTLIGDRTAGCSGNPKPANLGNGATVFVPSWKDLRLNGSCLEGEGFAAALTAPVGPRVVDATGSICLGGIRQTSGFMKGSKGIGADLLLGNPVKVLPRRSSASVHRWFAAAMPR